MLIRAISLSLNSYYKFTKETTHISYMFLHLSYCSTYDVLKLAYPPLVESSWGGSTHCRILQNTQNPLLKILEKTTIFPTIHSAAITH